jgi:hypothetical protein
MGEFMNKQELIDYLVRRYDGKYPASEYLDVDENITRYHSGEDWFESGSIRVSKKEFQQRARELGYLDEYFAVQGIDQQKIKNTLISDVAAVAKGRIINSPEALAQFDNDLAEHMKNKSESEWYDYANQKALRLPPVGVECEMLTCNKWELIKMVGFDDGFAVVKYLDDKSYHSQSGLPKFYRPLDHETRKAEAERKRVVDAAQKECVNFSSNDLGRLYDAGFLRMPEDK